MATKALAKIIVTLARTNVLKAKFNSLQIMASPSLGGVIVVPLEMCKKWDLEMSDEIFSDPDFVFENFEEAPQIEKKFK